jgi:DNA-binding response OmpR family regulator
MRIKTTMSLSEMATPGSPNIDSALEDVFDDGYLRLEHRHYYLTCGGELVSLPRTEFLIMSRLTRNPDRIVTAQELWQYAWGPKKPLNTESLHVYIYRLRGKLMPYKLRIETMVNVGYKLSRVYL